MSVVNPYINKAIKKIKITFASSLDVRGSRPSKSSLRQVFKLGDWYKCGKNKRDFKVKYQKICCHVSKNQRTVYRITNISGTDSESDTEEFMEDPLVGIKKRKISVFCTDHFKEQSKERHKMVLSSNQIYKILKTGDWEPQDASDTGKGYVYAIQHSKYVIVANVYQSPNGKYRVTAITTYPTKE